MKDRILHSVPKYGDRETGDVKHLQAALKEAGFDPGPSDDVFGDRTLKALQAFQKARGLPGTGVIPADGGSTFDFLRLILEPKHESEVRTSPVWLDAARKMLGKRETDPAFNKEMSAKWKLVGLNLGTISKNWAAWCGLFVAVTLAGAGYSWQKNGAGAKNWAQYGQAIEWKQNGIPRGAIVYINHNAKCDSGSGNHVALANGDCAPQDIVEMTKDAKGVWTYRPKKDAYVALIGGNQGNKVSVARYNVREICDVRWPKEEKLPPPVTVSKDCSTAGSAGGSTR